MDKILHLLTLFGVALFLASYTVMFSHNVYCHLCNFRLYIKNKMLSPFLMEALEFGAWCIITSLIWKLGLFIVGV